MADKIATREAYGKALAEFGAIYENLVVLDADLAAATKTGVFKKAFPERHFDCGIAENNMICVATGMSLCGKIPFASTFAMFAAGRSFEQIRNSIGYPHNNVKIGATHAGITVGEDGATHQCNEDIALMRTIPGMVIINPADAVEARLAVKAAIEYVGPVYLRFGRMAVPTYFDVVFFVCVRRQQTPSERHHGRYRCHRACLAGAQFTFSGLFSRTGQNIIIKAFAKQKIKFSANLFAASACN